MKFPDYKIHQELSFPLRAYAVNRLSTLTRPAQSGRPKKHTTCNYRSANDLHMTVPLVPGTFNFPLWILDTKLKELAGEDLPIDKKEQVA